MSEPTETTMQRKESINEIEAPTDLEKAYSTPTASGESHNEKFDSSISSDDDDSDYDCDGHRITRRDIRLTRSHNSAAAAARANRLRSVSTVTTTSSVRSRPRRTDSLSFIGSRRTRTFAHPLSHIPTGRDVLVDFDGPDDPYRPLNWPMRKKMVTTLIYALVTMSATWASSCYAAATDQVAEVFQVGTQVATLGTSLFLLGFGIGPLLWAPLSEVYGRRVAVLVPMAIAVCFSFGTATAKDFQTVILTRFFGGFFASAPVTNTGGVLGDLYSPAQRGVAMAGYAMAVVSGPLIGPIVSAVVVHQPGLGWRWTEYLTGILQAFVVLLGVLFTNESYPPKLLVYKARRLRVESGNWALHAKFEEWDVSVEELVRKFLIRPIQMLSTPICLLVAIYLSFCYGILYMQLGSIPIIFGEIRGWEPITATLPFLCILVGAVLGLGINIYNQILYNKVYHAAGNRAVPERRLFPMMLGSFLFAGSHFVVGWTSRPDIHWVVPCIGLVMLGIGNFTIFQAGLNYIVDTFQLYAASAVAANTFLRCCFATAFPLVVGPMYHNIGVGPASSITGGFATLLIPVPFVFYIYGKRIRASSKWSKGSVFD